MKKIILLLFVASLLTWGVGCASDPFSRARQNVENSKRLRVGMTKQQVLEIMGEPLRDETFCKPDIWFYYCRMNWGDGLTTEDECFPLLFKDGKLVGWGNDFLTRYRRENKNRVPDTELPLPGAEAPAK